MANVVLDTTGNLYGCAQGGSIGQGGVFELSPPAQPGGAWSETILHDFGNRYRGPVAVHNGVGCGITIDPATNRLFGSSYGGGEYQLGTIFELLPPKPGELRWNLKIIHSFDGSAQDGKWPVAPPLKVGDTYYGGNSTGTIYEFRP